MKKVWIAVAVWRGGEEKRLYSRKHNAVAWCKKKGPGVSKTYVLEFDLATPLVVYEDERNDAK